MEHFTEVFLGIDVAKARNGVAVADEKRGGEIRYLGEICATPEAMRPMVQRLASRHQQLHFCYEAGPSGYGLYRQIISMSYSCTAIAPSLIAERPGDWVKTNRRDAIELAKLLRAGELTAVWVPDGAHQAIRDLIRARTAAVDIHRVLVPRCIRIVPCVRIRDATDTRRRRRPDMCVATRQLVD